MNLGDTALVFGIAATLTGAAGTAGKYWMDQEYVPVGALQKAFQERDIRDLKRRIRQLEWLKQNGGLSDRQEWELNDLRHELEDLQQ